MLIDMVNRVIINDLEWKRAKKKSLEAIN